MAIDKVSALSRTVIFGGLDEVALRALAERAIERHLKRDEVLFVAGDTAGGLFVVVSGALRAFREGLDGREQVIHVERAGATIAELPVFDDGPYPSTVAAEEDSVVLFLATRDVKAILSQASREYAGCIETDGWPIEEMRRARRSIIAARS